jgi:5-methyltetrahydrofolate--homocysteine methyltransferase
MLIIGERLNTSRKGLDEAVQKRDEAFLKELARKQVESGAGYLDVNCGTRLQHEVEDLPLLVKLVQEAVDVPCSIDTPNPEAAEAALSVHKGKPIINSISAESDRYAKMLPLVKKYNAGVIALCMGDEGIPETVERKFEVASNLRARLISDGVPEENIYLDPLVQPVGANQAAGMAVANAIRELARSFPKTHISCGISNVSHGMPARKLLNRVFIVMCIAAGLDTAIVDPNDTDVMQCILAAEALVGRDEFCARYIDAYRAGKIA